MSHQFFVPGPERKKASHNTLHIRISRHEFSDLAFASAYVPEFLVLFLGVYLRFSWFLHRALDCFLVSLSKIPFYHSLFFSFAGHLLHIWFPSTSPSSFHLHASLLLFPRYPLPFAFDQHIFCIACLFKIPKPLASLTSTQGYVAFDYIDTVSPRK